MVMVPVNRSEEAVLHRMYLGLRERRPPQDVVVDIVELGAKRWLSAVGTWDLYAMMRYQRSHQLLVAENGPAVWTGPVGSSMPTAWRHHPGLTRAYEAARTAVDAVALTAGRSAPVAAEPADPASLRRSPGSRPPGGGSAPPCSSPQRCSPRPSSFPWGPGPPPTTLVRALGTWFGQPA
jgi:hypothetical protein